MGLLSVECDLVFFTASVLLSRLLCQLVSLLLCLADYFFRFFLSVGKN